MTPQPCGPVALAEDCITRLRSATSQLAALYPLDTPDKIKSAIGPWDVIYTIIGFTTLDSHAEHLLLTHPAIDDIITATRTAVRECEAAFEIFFARQISDPACADPRAELARFPIHVFYEHTAALEWHALTVVLGRAPQHVAVLGAGALPETCVWIQDWARVNKTPVRVHNVELFAERSELGRHVMDALGLFSSEDTTFEAGDACLVPDDLAPFDAVYLNATVGATVEDKDRAIAQVAGRMRKGAVMLVRGSHSIKTLFYPPTNMTSPALAKVLRPVLTYHMNGEVGRSINTSIIVSRVV
ncbi:Nicotianamine synthase protein [Microdochium nivale]|nr:Nicotianamine synthase protein [Microdochium nivale]